MYPGAIFLAPKNLLHKDIANELNVKVIGCNTGHLWEQADLPLYLAAHRHAPLLNLANTAPALYSNNYITIHDLAFYHHPEWNSKKFSAWYNILIPRIAAGARHVFTVSETVKAEIVTCYRLPAKKISVAYNGISQKMLSLGPGGGVKEKIILAVGTFNIRKNHPNLVAAYLKSTLRQSYTLVIIGDKNRVFRECKLDDTVITHNHIVIHETLSEDDLAATYRKAEIVASLSLYEGFGIPVLEGLYNGCKVLCSDIPVYRELYHDVAAFCDPSSVDGICRSLEEITTEKPVSSEKIGSLLTKYNYRQSAITMLEKIIPGFNPG